MLNYQNPSTVQEGRKATTQIAFVHLKALRPYERYKSYILSRTPTLAPIQSQSIPFKQRFTLMKADWNGYSAELAQIIRR